MQTISLKHTLVICSLLLSTISLSAVLYDKKYKGKVENTLNSKTTSLLSGLGENEQGNVVNYFLAVRATDSIRNKVIALFDFSEVHFVYELFATQQLLVRSNGVPLKANEYESIGGKIFMGFQTDMEVAGMTGSFEEVKEYHHSFVKNISERMIVEE